MSVIAIMLCSVITENSNCFEILLHYSGGSGLTGSAITGVDCSNILNSISHDNDIQVVISDFRMSRLPDRIVLMTKHCMESYRLWRQRFYEEKNIQIR